MSLCRTRKTFSYNPMKTEAWLSKNIRQRFHALRVYSLESAGVPGLPDLYLVGRGVKPFWLELKVAASPGSAIPFRPGQPEWLDEHHRSGGSALILVYTERPAAFSIFEGGWVRQELLGRKISSLGDSALGCIPVGGPEAWEELENTLAARFHH